jgi:Na+-translocating ferredoxin:NAD+ oxidoreductase RnfG subunit
MSSNLRYAVLPIALAVCAPAHALVYLDVAQAQKLMFSDAAMTPLPIVLTQAQVAAIERNSGSRVASPVLRVWRTRDGFFVVDAVIGKHDLISYAVGFDNDGKVRQVEILEYREAYGGEVRNTAWLAQFKGKHFGDSVHVGQDIQNISGATLSSTHLSDGIRRLLATYDIALKGH